MPLSKRVTSLAIALNGKGSARTTSGSLSVGPLSLFNLILLGLCLALILCYVVWSNNVASGNYSVKVLNSKIANLNDLNSSLATSRTSMEDPNSVIEFAKAHNMVEAKNISYVFENGNVALQK